MNQHKKDQKGVALIFAIGIVGLMMMLAITYATVSITERDISGNATAQYTARMLAESAANNVLQLLRQETANSNMIRVADVISYGTGGVDSRDLLLTHIPGMAADDNKSYESYNYLNGLINKSESAERPKWHLIRAKDNKGEDRIIGRYIYAAFKPRGILDPVSMVNSSNATSNIVSIASLNTTALGMSNKSSISNVFDPTAYWLFNKENPQSGTTEQIKIAKNKYFNWYFTVPKPPRSRETFFYSTTGNEADIKEYKRFNLNRTDWNSIDVDSIRKLDNLKTLSDDGDTTCIPWFSGDDPNHKKEQTAANFIAYMAGVHSGNDHDYEKVKSSLTESENYFPNFRVPYINEIGVKVSLQLISDGERNQQDENHHDKLDSEGNTITEYKYSIMATVTVEVELLNYFNYGNSSENFKIEGALIELNGLKFKANNFTFDDDAVEKEIFPDSDPQNVLKVEDKTSGDGLSWTISKPCFRKASATFLLNKGSGWSTNTSNISVSLPSGGVNPPTYLTVKFKNLYLKTTSNDKKVDYVRFNDKTISVDLRGTELKKDGDGKTAYFLYSAMDASNNLDPDNWKSSNATDSSPVEWTINDENWETWTSGTESAAKNKVVSNKYDRATNDKLLSDYVGTPYQGNVQEFSASPLAAEKMVKPDTSNFHPGMLGFINRCENWRTLNLLKLNDAEDRIIIKSDKKAPWNKNAMDVSADGYAKGDANLLDQVCWLSNASNYYESGKININAIQKRVSGTSSKLSIDNTVAAQILLTTADINVSDLATAVATTAALETTRLAVSRGKLADYITTSGSDDTKNAKEKKLGKYVFATKAAESPTQVGDTLYLVVVAQAINDRGTVSGIMMLKKSDRTQTTTAKKNEFDPETDEITAIQKILVLLQKDNNDKWQLVRIQYVD